MIYTFTHNSEEGYKQFQIESWDNTVIKTSPGYEGFVKCKLTVVLSQLVSRGWTWKVSTMPMPTIAEPVS